MYKMRLSESRNCDDVKYQRYTFEFQIMSNPYNNATPYEWNNVSPDHWNEIPTSWNSRMHRGWWSVLLNGGQLSSYELACLSSNPFYAFTTRSQDAANQWSGVTSSQFANYPASNTLMPHLTTGTSVNQRVTDPLRWRNTGSANGLALGQGNSGLLNIVGDTSSHLSQWNPDLSYPLNGAAPNPPIPRLSHDWNRGVSTNWASRLLNQSRGAAAPPLPSRARLYALPSDSPEETPNPGSGRSSNSWNLRSTPTSNTSTNRSTFWTYQRPPSPQWECEETTKTTQPENELPSVRRIPDTYCNHMSWYTDEELASALETLQAIEALDAEYQAKEGIHPVILDNCVNNPGLREDGRMVLPVFKAGEEGIRVTTMKFPSAYDNLEEASDSEDDMEATTATSKRRKPDRDLNKNRDNNMEANFIALNDKDVVSFYEASKEKKTVIISMLKSASVPLQTTLWKIFFSNIVSLIDHNVGYRCLEEVANVTKSDTYINIKKMFRYH
ncbi:hypothetical protein QR680_003143 [Steinernema hermaphroditum]|uniref:Uncharacterized protein n=1 Tax=Steinernema hermaphroditum TaxID=289476 RepID=A0AA39LJR7_9BILA|nr:hypothetical protein QR680_003143 [Steinernema hermaphroditum]